MIETAHSVVHIEIHLEIMHRIAFGQHSQFDELVQFPLRFRNQLVHDSSYSLHRLRIQHSRLIDGIHVQIDCHDQCNQSINAALTLPPTGQNQHAESPDQPLPPVARLLQRQHHRIVIVAMASMEPRLVDGNELQHHEHYSHQQSEHRQDGPVGIHHFPMVRLHPEKQSRQEIAHPPDEFGDKIGDEGINGHQIDATLALRDAVEHKDHDDGQEREQVHGVVSVEVKQPSERKVAFQLATYFLPFQS